MAVEQLVPVDAAAIVPAADVLFDMGTDSELVLGMDRGECSAADAAPEALR